MLKIDLLTNAVARARLATPDSESSDASSSSFSSDSASESISLPMNARAFLELLFLWDEDLEGFDEEDFEDVFFFFESSEL